MPKTKPPSVTWEVSGVGTMELDDPALEDMSDDEIEEWVRTGVDIRIHEQGIYLVYLSGLRDAILDLRRQAAAKEEG